MLKDITLGQYFPGNSVIHRLDPRTKLILLVAYIAALFIASNFLSYALTLGFLVVCIAISGIQPKAFFKGLKPLIFLMCFTGIMNLFFSSGETLLVHFWIINIYLEGLVRAVFMILRLLALICATFLLTYTTSPIALTDALESLLRPLGKIGLPVHELAMIMCIALRFIPTLLEETDKIISAQKARGADFETGSLIQRVKALIPILVPLFISAFRRADELATAMECRCYQGGEGRTKLKQLHYAPLDYWAFGVLALLLAATITLTVFGL